MQGGFIGIYCLFLSAVFIRNFAIVSAAVIFRCCGVNDEYILCLRVNCLAVGAIPLIFDRFGIELFVDLNRKLSGVRVCDRYILGLSFDNVGI